MSTAIETSVKEALKRSMIVPVFYHEDYEVSEQVMSICFEEGIEVFEYTNRGEKAADNFIRLQEFARNKYPDMFLGIGTVKTVQQAEQFLPHKPSFVVSPIVHVPVGELCVEAGIPWMPGCMTPTEIHEASTNGAAVVKIFPANLATPAYVKAVRAVFPGVDIMPTGGIRADKAILKEWFEAGVLCVGMGSELLERELIQQKNWIQLRTKIALARQLVISCTS